MVKVEVYDFTVLGLEMEGQVAAFPSETAKGALQGPAKMLDFIPFVYGHEVLAHLWVLGFGSPLPPPPPKMRGLFLNNPSLVTGIGAVTGRATGSSYTGYRCSHCWRVGMNPWPCCP